MKASVMGGLRVQFVIGMLAVADVGDLLARFSQSSTRVFGRVEALAQPRHRGFGAELRIPARPRRGRRASRSSR